MQWLVCLEFDEFRIAQPAHMALTSQRDGTEVRTFDEGIDPVSTALCRLDGVGIIFALLGTPDRLLSP